MRLPVISGVIDRRILVNFHADPEVLARVLPPPFEPKIVQGQGVVGVCLIRLHQIRPLGLPRFIGIRSENAAHRFAVSWRDNGTQHSGVYIPRRDTSSRLNTLVGGRLFPGKHHLARFRVNESSSDYSIAMSSRDDAANITVEGSVTSSLPDSSLFSSISEASAFFEAGALGYSATNQPGQFDGLELRCHSWQVHPLEVTAVRSSFFEDTAVFPEGSVRFDCALLMRHIQHEWHSREQLCCGSEQGA